MKHWIKSASFLAALICFASEARAVEVSGRARVIDGDTLKVGRTSVRLFGIDAPEGAQLCMDASGRDWGCGLAASRQLETLTGSRSITCHGSKHDENRRLLAVCTVAGLNINQRLVNDGLAWAFVGHAFDYVAAEREAREANRGVFAANNMPPWVFRDPRVMDRPKQAESAQATVAARNPRCTIKGDISKSGRRIYHVKRQRSYASIDIDETKGERWFCNVREAKRAGWRPR